MTRIQTNAASILLKQHYIKETTLTNSRPPSTEQKLLLDIETLLTQLNQKSHKDEIQHELSKLMLLYPGILKMVAKENHYNLRPYCLQQFYNCLVSLQLEEPNLNLTINVRRKLRELTFNSGPISSYFYSAAPEGKAFMGLMLSTAVLLLTTLAMTNWNIATEILSFKANLFTVILFGGGLGSIVSILGRIDQFSKMNDTSVLFFTGCVRPIIGIGFALFVCALLKSEMLPLKTTVNESTFLALSFLAGFSERFGSTVAERSEKLSGGVKVDIRT